MNRLENWFFQSAARLDWRKELFPYFVGALSFSVLEVIKWHWDSRLSPWQSHAIIIGFAALLVGVGARRIRQLGASLHAANEMLQAEVAERELAEQRLRSEVERFNIAAKATDGAIWEWDLATNVLVTNGVAHRQFGREAGASLSAHACLKRIHPDDIDRVEGGIRRVIAEGKVFWTDEYRLQRADGSYANVLDRAYVLRDSLSRPTRMIGAMTDITVSKVAQSEIVRAKEAAEAAAIVKREFLANMSHEIRTPLNGIIGMTRLALDTDLTIEQRDYLQAIEHSSNALLAVVNDILDFSNLETRKLEFNLRPFLVRETVTKTLKSLEAEALEKGISLTCRIATDVPQTVVGDPVRLGQVLINLLRNAIKFTSRGDVVVEVRPAEHGSASNLHFSVRDTGIGIPADKQTLIFEAFAQADTSLSRQHGGIGLGLAISSALVKVMNGEIWLESHENVGSTFHFTAELPPAADNLELAPSDVDARPSHEASTCTSSLTVLLAEDNPINQRLATRMLETCGHRVVIARTGLEAVEAAKSQRVDVILMDVQMPGMDGFKATELIREEEKKNGRRTPIIALTAHAMTGDRERCLEAGMDNYLSKPMQMNELTSVLETIAIAPIAQDPASLLDLNALRSNIGGDENFLRKLTQLFATEQADLRAQISSAVAARDCAALRYAAHSLKGAMSSFAPKIGLDSAATLEAMGQRGDLSGAEALVGRMERELDLLTSALLKNSNCLQPSA